MNISTSQYPQHLTRSKLSRAEQQTLKELQPRQGNEAESVVIFCDVGRDQDDELALATLAKLHHMGNVNIKGVITNLGPSDKRAQLAKGALGELGLSEVPVAVGSSSGQSPDKYDHYEFEAPYMAPQQSVEKSGQSLLKTIFQSADDRSVNLVVLGPMTDLNEFMTENTELFRQKAERGVIMGGVQRQDGEILLKDGLMVPDTANNNTFDTQASSGVYAGLQNWGIPTTVLTREAAYAAPADKDFYNGLGDTGNPVGERLKATQRRSIEGLWERVNMTADDPNRLGLPGRCDKAWFEKTFCDGPVPEGSDVWDSIARLPVYDAVAGLAVLGEEQSSKLFAPEKVQVGGVTHQVIGLSKEHPGMGRLKANQAISALAKSVMLEH
ncbi:MAG: nucleoside hydrolase [Candidatus Eremiobacteraeota bacterium]|nr:nucleoside hydrolase [Candidatus Eremiobacteraeota bacterium]